MAEPKFRRDRRKRAPAKERMKRYRTIGIRSRLDDIKRQRRSK